MYTVHTSTVLETSPTFKLLIRTSEQHQRSNNKKLTTTVVVHEATKISYSQ